MPKTPFPHVLPVGCEIDALRALCDRRLFVVTMDDLTGLCRPGTTAITGLPECQATRLAPIDDQRQDTPLFVYRAGGYLSRDIRSTGCVGAVVRSSIDARNRCTLRSRCWPRWCVQNMAINSPAVCVGQSR